MPESAQVPLEQIAHHEAGHYVAGYILRPEDARYGVTIAPAGDYLGSSDGEEGGTWTETGEVVLSEEEGSAMLIELYAGWAAQCRFAPDARDDSRASDDLKANDYLYLLEADDVPEEPTLYAKYDWMGTPQAEAAELRWRAKTEAFVLEHWATIETLANELLQHNRLDEIEADMICALARGEPGTTAQDLAQYRGRKDMVKGEQLPTHAAFVNLLERCITQVQADPSGYTENPHLYDLLDKIHLRLCHGNRPDSEVPHGEA